MRNRSSRTPLTLVFLGLSLVGCVVSPFPRNIHISTKTAAVGAYEEVGPISTEECFTLVLVAPIPEPINPTVVYERLFAKVDILKADAMIDYQVRGADFAGFIPFFVRACVEHRAMAVRLL